MISLKELMLLVSIVGAAVSLLVMFYKPWLGFALVIVNFCCAIAFAISIFKD